MEITLTQLCKAMPYATYRNRQKYLKWLNQAMQRYDINTPMRVAHFLAQIAWESGNLKYSEEVASGKDYEGRKDLGNIYKGDGVRFKGRGLIQLTGRKNYTAYGKHIGVDLTKNEQWLTVAHPELACDSAGWFWQTNGLNELADKDEFTKITKIINGSTKTVPQRLPYLGYAKKALR